MRRPGVCMSYMKEAKSSKFDRDPALSSPLAAAVSVQDRETLAMVSSALKDRRMRLAFQPAVYAADPSVIGFFEGFIRLLNLRDQVIPARDFMATVEQQQLGREIEHGGHGAHARLTGGKRNGEERIVLHGLELREHRIGLQEFDLRGDGVARRLDKHDHVGVRFDHALPPDREPRLGVVAEDVC